MSAKSDRKAMLINIHLQLDNPQIEPKKNSKGEITIPATLSPLQLDHVLQLTKMLLKADGVVGLDPKAKVNG